MNIVSIVSPGVKSGISSQADAVPGAMHARVNCFTIVPVLRTPILALPQGAFRDWCPDLLCPAGA
jgi:hypothetical protein